ncbi:hypothetical protein N7492_006151 [Penicillium capsulatum]|uniref:Uncharacterized protein n=1 Tax=Penicillium capsulatum TaxID=69766 RepID=A0A9W9I0X4_9EURO|nr:hypothetical protein N7492_006151 [Penicillium capsulatum]KAJ6108803.1 hypothetical protein N7512_008640 [Penicillium capsulatum]
MSGTGQHPVGSMRPESTVGPESSQMDVSGSTGQNEAVRRSGSRRRRRPADANSRPKTQLFYFVDSSSSSKEKRAHVMRHHVQEKKKQRKNSHGAMSAETMSDVPSASIEDELIHEADNPKPTATAGGQFMAPEQDSSLPIRFSTVTPFTQPPLPLKLGSPTTILNESRNEPLSGLPITNPDDVELVEWWINKLSYWSGQNHYVKNQMFRTALQHPLSFQAIILTYSARWRAQMNGVSDSHEVQRHVGESHRNIEDALSGLVPVSQDHIATAMIGMTLQEERFGSRQDSQAYLDRALRIMRPLTGTNVPADVLVQYIRYIIPPPSATLGLAGRDWLVTFLRGAEDLTRTHSSPEYLAQVPQRQAAFQMGSPLFSLLSSGPRPSQVPPESRRFVVPGAQTLEVSRAAALIYITAALWDFKDSTSKTARFLIYLQAIVEQHQLDRELNCETLLWLLLEQGCDPDLRDPERAWSTGELLQANKQLRPELQFHFNEILMGFFTLQPPIRGIDAFAEEVDRSFSSIASPNFHRIDKHEHVK